MCRIWVQLSNNPTGDLNINRTRALHTGRAQPVESSERWEFKSAMGHDCIETNNKQYDNLNKQK